ncbi:hypothetical protein TNCV_2722521 [Trichonephila clavipes]|nr:hypothetical protein TNCV_2722521 [Trichonephila clavipes]
MEPRAWSQRLAIISSRKDRHVTSVALMDRAATSRALSQELESFAGQQVSARRLDDVCSKLNTLLTLNEVLIERGITYQRSSAFLHPSTPVITIAWKSNEGKKFSCKCLKYYRQKLQLDLKKSPTGPRVVYACTSPSPSVLVWDTIGYTSLSVLVRIDGTLNSARYISDLSPIENLCFMIVKRLARHHMLVPSVDELGHHVEAALASVPVHAIQSLSESMPRHIRVVITAREGSSGY